MRTVMKHCQKERYVNVSIAALTGAAGAHITGCSAA